MFFLWKFPENIPEFFLKVDVNSAYLVVALKEINYVVTGVSPLSDNHILPILQQAVAPYNLLLLRCPVHPIDEQNIHQGPEAGCEIVPEIEQGE